MDIKQLLRDRGFRFNKQFGQNFLTDENLLNDICADAGIDGGTVVEVGAGAGTLTRALSRHAGKVIAFEIDRNLEPVLALTLADCPNVRVEIGDIMRYKMSDVEALCDNKPFRVVANIPYYITTPLLMEFVEHSSLVTSLTLTIQKEVADRLSARPCTKDYGAITVAVDAVANVTTTRVLPRTLFYPAPNVDSAVVRIDIDRTKYDIADHALFRRTVKAAFAMRRKTLVNNLMVGFSLSRADAENVLARADLAVGCRGEELSTEQFFALYKVLAEVTQK